MQVFVTAEAGEMSDAMRRQHAADVVDGGGGGGGAEERFRVRVDIESS